MKRVIKMLQKDKKERNQLEFVSIEALVPEEHLLRKIDAAVDFNKIYEFVEDLYCPDCGTRQAPPVHRRGHCRAGADHRDDPPPYGKPGALKNSQFCCIIK